MNLKHVVRNLVHPGVYLSMYPQFDASQRYASFEILAFGKTCNSTNDLQLLSENATE